MGEMFKAHDFLCQSWKEFRPEEEESERLTFIEGVSGGAAVWLQLGCAVVLRRSKCGNHDNASIQHLSHFASRVEEIIP
jgi:hypothetical protein